MALELFPCLSYLLYTVLLGTLRYMYLFLLDFHLCQIYTQEAFWIDNWLKKMFHTQSDTETHTLDYYSAIKHNKILPFAAKWIDLQNIIPSEVSQTENDIIT